MTRTHFYAGEGEAIAARDAARLTEVRSSAETFGSILGELASTAKASGIQLGYCELAAIAEARANEVYPGDSPCERVFAEVARVSSIGGESEL